MNTARVTAGIAWLCIAAVVAPAQGQERSGKEKEEHPVHNELRALRDRLTEAVRKGDIDKQLECVSKDVVVTWQNGEVVRGQQALKDFYAKNMGGASKVFRGYSQPPAPTDLTILYGPDTGISYGTSVAKYNILGKEFELTNHWTATVVKENGKWVVASYHVSGNILDNPLLNTAKSALYWTGGIAVVLGLLIGVFVGRLGRAQAPSAPA
jgi:ketosteroid isomerase-like protein